MTMHLINSTLPMLVVSHNLVCLVQNEGRETCLLLLVVIHPPELKITRQLL